MNRDRNPSKVVSNGHPQYDTDEIKHHTSCFSIASSSALLWLRKILLRPLWQTCYPMSRQWGHVKLHTTSKCLISGVATTESQHAMTKRTSPRAHSVVVRSKEPTTALVILLLLPCRIPVQALMRCILISLTLGRDAVRANSMSRSEPRRFQGFDGWKLDPPWKLDISW